METTDQRTEIEKVTKIEPIYLDGEYTIDSIEVAKELRINYHIVTNPLVQIKIQQEYLFGVDKYSIACLHELYPEFVQIEKSEEERLKKIREETKYQVYLDLYKHGYFILNGSKYGADFAVYKDDPLVIHASALIFIFEKDDPADKHNIIELNRISTIAKKDCVIAYRATQQSKDDPNPSPIHYNCISRCAVSWHKVEGKRWKK